MLVYVLGTSNKAHTDATIANLSHIAPEWSVQLVHDYAAETLNEHLHAYDQPFFITLQAGDLLHSGFLTELSEHLTALPEQCAGLVYERGTPAARHNLPSPPLVWRTNAARSSGRPFFSEKDRLPFETYLLMDKVLQLQGAWSWPTIISLWWQPQAIHYPKWQRKQEEWDLVRPILEAGLAASRPKEEPSPAISIVICTFNNADYLLWSIRSVLAQSIPDWELIIIDDASSDNTKMKLASLPADPRIRMYTNPANYGKARSLNTALTLTRTPWLLELDADDWLPPDAVRILLSAANTAAPETSLLYGDYYEWTEGARKQLIFGGIRQTPAQVYPEALLAEALPIAPRCYRVAALQGIQGWMVNAPYEGRLYEDFEIIIRLSRSYALRHLSEPLYHRRIRNSSITHQHAEKYADWMKWIKKEHTVLPQGDGGDSRPST
ncbi:glycosyltransferase family 2 protein [Paenibacillus planticolens]|uniref:Glycosyltransferase n=1 Tax=Paenibacillus planticolens TaxID=2654976 RepID=A0ABX1ZW32_9BACL|nr:glycosyltransferase family 2 protein [Paenibacillus planticolens]NOV04255.1 glycosyltransferase [Paenibacillus planticolens]